MSKRSRRRKKRQKRSRKPELREEPTPRSLQLHGKVSKVAKGMGGEEVIELLKLTIQKVSSTVEALKLCTYFQFLDSQRLQNLEQGGFELTDKLFWLDFNQLLIYSLRCEATSILKIIEAIGCAIETKNEVMLALASRSFIEHSCATHCLSSQVAQRQAYLTEKIWGLDADCRIPAPSEQDKELRNELIRFAIGRRVQFNDQVPLPTDSKGIWDKFNQSLRNVPEQLQPRNILTHIDRTANREGYRELRAVYEFLCEYCHPNSSSRSFEFYSEDGALSHRSVLISGDITLGFYHVFHVLKGFAPELCRLLIHAFDVLEECTKPMPPMKTIDQEGIPSIGTIPISDQYGRLQWVNQSDIAPSTIKGLPLCLDHKQRVEQIYSVFSEVSRQPFGQWIKDFEKEPDPEREISLWEHMAEVYKKEVQERGSLSQKQRRLLYEAVKFAPGTSSAEQMLSSMPGLKALPDLSRVVERMMMRKLD